MTIQLTNFRTLETGSDGGHSYVTSEINYKGQTRNIVVFFADKCDEQKLKGRTEIKVNGKLIDEKGQSLNLLDSRLIDNDFEKMEKQELELRIKNALILLSDGHPFKVGELTFGTKGRLTGYLILKRLES
jgi:hypothetical protein